MSGILTLIAVVFVLIFIIRGGRGGVWGYGDNSMNKLILTLAIVLVVFTPKPAAAHDRQRNAIIQQQVNEIKTELARLRFEMEMLRGDVLLNAPPVIPLYRPAQ